MQRVQRQVDDMFPADGPLGGSNCTASDKIELPLIDGYVVDSILGRGGMGIVFKAKHLKLNRFVALKMMLNGPFAGSLELARFRREALAVAALKHPNIVQIHDVGDLDDCHHFTMELVEGGNLSQKLDGKPQPMRAAAEMVATLACAVQFAHQSGFVHRDLKPANILLTSNGVPKISDFGLARSIESGPEFTLTGARVGTPSYMAPEQALGNAHEIGPAVDVYGLGAILYEMLAGRPPFKGGSAIETQRQVIADEPPSPSRFNPKLSRDLETICLKCLQKNPSRRYASAQGQAGPGSARRRR
jgi:serine/threonine-protein kinase